MTVRRAQISNSSPTTTPRLSLKSASPWITRTPSPEKRSVESIGAIESITERTWVRTLAKSTRTSAACTPNAQPERMSCARLAAASAFDGMQPVLRLSPPIRRRSISTIETPNTAAAAATERPAAPPPITQMTGASFSMRSSESMAECLRNSRGDAAPTAPSAQQYRQQREYSQSDQGREQLWREHITSIEAESTHGFTARKAARLRLQLHVDNAV